MTDSAAMEITPLEVEHLFHLFMARNWLALGGINEAREEFERLPPEIRMHPQARDVRRQLESKRN